MILKISPSRNLIVRQLHAVRNYVELDRDLIEIGKEQNVDFVLASNYQISNGRIKLNPSSDYAYRWYGNRLVRYGRTDEALAAMKTAIDNNPTSIFHHAVYGWVLYMARRNDEAIEQLGRVVEMDPSFLWAYDNLWLAYHAKGNHERAFEWFIKFHRQAGTGSELINRFNSDY